MKILDSVPTKIKTTPSVCSLQTLKTSLYTPLFLIRLAIILQFPFSKMEYEDLIKICKMKLYHYFRPYSYLFFHIYSRLTPYNVWHLICFFVSSWTWAEVISDHAVKVLNVTAQTCRIMIFTVILLFLFTFHFLFVNDAKSILVFLGIQLSHKDWKDYSMDQGSLSIYNTQ